MYVPQFSGTEVSMTHQGFASRRAAALGLTSVLTAFGFVASSQAAATRAQAAAPMKRVLIKESHERYGYTPRAITVQKGMTVTWTNKTDVEHNVTVTQGVKINDDIETGKTVKFTFTRTGTYKYHCEYHPYMKGTIVVK